MYIFFRMSEHCSIFKFASIVITGAMIYDEVCLITFSARFNATPMKYLENLPSTTCSQHSAITYVRILSYCIN